MKLISLGQYSGLMRSVAHAVKDGDADGCAFAAKYYAAALPENAMIVPMPSHNGKATTMLKVANYIRNEREDVTVCDCLEAEPHESSYWTKKEKRTPRPFKMTARIRPTRNRPVWVIDNCACSLVTAAMASHALPEAKIMVLAKSSWR